MNRTSRIALPVYLAGALVMTGCGGQSGEGGTPSAGATTSSTASTTPSAVHTTTATSDGGGSASGAQASGSALAASIRKASTGIYTVTSEVKGATPAKVTGRGDLAARTLAVHVAATPDVPAQEIEVVDGTAYTTLDGVTTGRQRVAVSLTDPGEQLRDTVAPFVAATDLDRVVAAIKSATSVTPDATPPAGGATRSLRALVPARGLAVLFGVPLDSSVPSLAPVVVGLDDAGRVRTVRGTLGQTVRTSTYGGYEPGAAITAPAKGDIVENPL